MRNTRLTRVVKRAFTLTELLIVVLIITALLLIAVPAFSSLLASSEATMAENMVQVGLRGGRDAALRASSRDDAAVVFLYDPAPRGGRLVITPYVKVADFYDLPTNLPAARMREIFVPVADVEPVQLPKHWMVRGYAPANSIETGGLWYDGNRYGQDLRRGDWVFPETGFYTPGGDSEGKFRQSFMIRFEAGSGVIASSNALPALVFAPTQADPGAFAGLPNAEIAELRGLRLSNPKRYVQRVIASTTITATSKLALLGPDSADMVSVRPVPALALYNELKMAESLKARLDPDTGCLYKKQPGNQRPTFVPVTGPGGTETDADPETGQFMNQWIEGDTNLRDGIQAREDGDEPYARLYVIERYTGTLKRLETQP